MTLNILTPEESAATERLNEAVADYDARVERHREHANTIAKELVWTQEKLKDAEARAKEAEAKLSEAHRVIKQAEWRLKHATVFSDLAPEYVTPLTAYLDSVGEDHYT